MWALFWCLFGLAGWVLYYVVEAAYSDLLAERNDLHKQVCELLGTVTEKRGRVA